MTDLAHQSPQDTNNETNTETNTTTTTTDTNTSTEDTKNIENTTQIPSEPGVKIKKKKVKKLGTRVVHCQDAVEWIKSQETLQGSIITSLPDVCEVPMSLPEWKVWFSHCVTLILSRLHPQECAIFYQTDVKNIKSGKYPQFSLLPSFPFPPCLFVEWIDKSYLVHKGADQVEGVHLVWHKIMSFKTDITTPTATRKKAGYSHMLCFRRDTSMHYETLPDVCPRGRLIWPKGMGFDACVMAVKYAKKFGSKCILDPFCGKGSVLAIANYYGLDSVGVELSHQRARNAISLQIDTDSNKFIWNDEEQPSNENEGNLDSKSKAEGHTDDKLKVEENKDTTS